MRKLSYITKLATDHAASSYGIPVLVLDGVAYGPADALPVPDPDPLAWLGGATAAEAVRNELGEVARAIEHNAARAEKLACDKAARMALADGAHPESVAARDAEKSDAEWTAEAGEEIALPSNIADLIAMANAFVGAH